MPTDSIFSTAEVRPLLDRVDAAMAAAGYPDADIFGMRLALEEALVNGVRHGNKGDPAKRVWVTYHVNAQHVVAEVEDEGDGFDPKQVPDPLAPENLEKPSGWGLFLMRSYLTWCRHNPRGNRVSLCRRRSEPGSGA
jgi:serine/threonine-protein kinase RsbW